MKLGTRVVVHTPHAWGQKSERATVMYPGRNFPPPSGYLLVRLDGERDGICVPRSRIAKAEAA